MRRTVGLGQTIAILANVGVIAGIVFLAFEIQQNNEFLAAQADYNVLQNRTATYVPLMLESRSVVDLLVKNNAGEELDPAESIQLSTIPNWFLTNWEREFGEFYQGRLSESDLPMEPWRDPLRGADAVGDIQLLEFWEASKYRFPPEFQSFMDDVVIPGM
jgi:hypothetical protein